MTDLPKRSRDFLEAACLDAIQKGWPAAKVVSVEIVRIYPKVPGPNWKLSSTIPPMDSTGYAKVRTLVGHLPQTWALAGD